MSRERSNPLSELARYGFEELSEALKNLDRLIELIGDRARVSVVPLSNSGSPDSALMFLIRFAEEQPKLVAKLMGSESSAERLCAIAGASDALAELMLRRPELAKMLSKPAQLPKE